MRSFLMIAPTRVTRGSACCAHCAPFELGVLAHAAEFQHVENLASQAHARLPVQRRRPPAVLEFDGEEGEQHGRQLPPRARRGWPVDRARGRKTGATGRAETPARISASSGFSKSMRTRPVSRSRKVRSSVTSTPASRQSSSSGSGKPRRRSSIATTISVTPRRPQRLDRPPSASSTRSVGNGTWLARRLHEACQREAGPVGRAAQPGNGGRGGPGTVDEDAPLEDLLVGDAGEDQARERSRHTAPGSRRAPRRRAPGAGSARHRRAPQSRMMTRAAPPAGAPECR